jgi:CTP synthase (UTP-ammonia lyase)
LDKQRNFEKEPKKIENLKEYHGIIVPGGFGVRHRRKNQHNLNFVGK